MSLPQSTEKARSLFQTLFQNVSNDRLLLQEPATQFDFLFSNVSEEARLAVSRLAAPKQHDTQADTPDGADRFAVVIVESGEFPVVKLFKTAEQLARYVGTLEGQDVCVVCFHGQFMPITAGKPRYIIMGTDSVSVPLSEHQKPTVVGTTTVTAKYEVQDDGFIGPPELATSYASTAHKPAK